MTFIQHLGELRQRLIACVLAFVVASALTFFEMAPVVHWLQRLAPAHTVFVQLAPGELFMGYFKLSMMTGLGVSLPFILYQFFCFISPALAPREKRLVFPLIIGGLGMFVLGVFFGYKGLLPTMLDFFLGFGQDVARNQLSIAAYLDFCTGFLVATGLVFQLPMVLLVLSFMNLVTSQKLAQLWKFAIVGSLIIGALITPTVDAGSQLMMSASLMALYGVSILLIKCFGR